jgi:hypothetical protein
MRPSPGSTLAQRLAASAAQGLAFGACAASPEGAAVGASVVSVDGVVEVEVDSGEPQPGNNTRMATASNVAKRMINSPEKGP